MGILNRAIVIILALGLLAVAASLLVAPVALLTAAETAVAQVREAPPLPWATAALVLAAAALVLLLLEVWPTEARVLQVRFEGGTLQYPADAVTEMVTRELAQVEGVERARASTRLRRGKLQVSASLATLGTVDPQAIGAEGARRLRERVERGLGLPLGEILLSLRPGATRMATGAPPARQVQEADTGSPVASGPVAAS